MAADCSAAVIGGAWLATRWTVAMAGLLRLDAALRTWVVLHRAAFLNRPLLVFSDIAWLGILWLLIAVALAWRRTIPWSDVARLVLALAMSALVTDHLLKPLIGRARPFTTSAVAAVIGHSPHGGSFPSGHATAAFAGATVLARCAPSLAWLWWLIAALVGYTRVYLGVHYPLDVIGGAVIGVLCGLVALYLTGRGRGMRRAAR